VRLQAGRAARLAGLALLSAALAGCLDVPTSSVAPTFGPTPEPTPPTTTYAPGTTVWYEGLLVTVRTITATLDQRGGPVVVALHIENPGEDEAELDARVLLQVEAGSSAPPIAPTRDSKIPSIPGAGSADASLIFELQGIASVDKGVVQIGESPLHVAQIPLGPAGGDPITFEPINLTPSGSTVAGDLRVTVRSGVLRWDLPDWSQELDARLAVLSLTYDVTYQGDFSGGFAFTGANVALRLADGHWVQPRRDGHSQSIELIGAGRTARGLSSRFEIPTGMRGRFALVVRSGSTSKLIPFTVGG
jgi:hypothetical protein